MQAARVARAAQVVRVAQVRVLADRARCFSRHVHRRVVQAALPAVRVARAALALKQPLMHAARVVLAVPDRLAALALRQPLTRVARVVRAAQVVRVLRQLLTRVARVVLAAPDRLAAPLVELAARVLRLVGQDSSACAWKPLRIAASVS